MKGQSVIELLLLMGLILSLIGLTVGYQIQNHLRWKTHFNSFSQEMQP